jgi:hypothetical protein
VKPVRLARNLDSGQPDHEYWLADVAFIARREQICLENGAREFWAVDPVRSQVKVSTPDGHSVAYKSGQEIPLLFGGTLAVDSIFA